MKKIFVLLLSIVSFFALSFNGSSAYALDNDEENVMDDDSITYTTYTEEYNEYERMLEERASMYRTFDFSDKNRVESELEFFERNAYDMKKNYTDDELTNLGYTTEQVEAIKSYDGSVQKNIIIGATVKFSMSYSFTYRNGVSRIIFTPVVTYSNASNFMYGSIGASVMGDTANWVVYSTSSMLYKVWVYTNTESITHGTPDKMTTGAYSLSFTHNNRVDGKTTMWIRRATFTANGTVNARVDNADLYGKAAGSVVILKPTVSTKFPFISFSSFSVSYGTFNKVIKPSK